MNELTLESLARRVEALEAALASLATSSTKRPSKDWRRVIGMFGESEFMREVDEEGRRLREAEREEARRETPPE